MRLFISFLVLFVCFSITQNAKAQYVVTCTNCSDTFTQSLDHVTNIEQLSQLYTQVEQSLQQTAKQIELVQQGIEQYENMLQNTAKLPSSFASKLQGMLSKLSSLTQQLDLQRGDASALSQIFKATYKSVDDIHDVMSSAKDSMTEVNSLRKKWSEEVDRSHQAAFQESGMQISDIEQKASDLDSQLNDLLTTPDGQMKALEAGNQIAAMQLQESQRLRSLLAISTQANVQKTMKDEKNEQLSEEAFKDAFETDKLKGYDAQIDF